MAIRRRIFRVILVIVSLLVLVVLAAALVLHSARFHRYVLAVIVRDAQAATGGRVQIGDFNFRLSGLRVDFYRVTLHGTELDATAPLFWADHIAAGVRLGSWHDSSKISLNDLEIDHPVVHLSVDAQGHSNLPVTPQPAGSTPTNVFQMAVSYAGIEHGDLYYNDAYVPLTADARNVEARVRFNPITTAYDGSLSYLGAHVRFSGFNPLTHDLKMDFSAAPSGVTLTSLVVRAGSSRVAAQARMNDYSDPSIEGSYEAALSGSELSDLLKDPSLPRGTVETKGTVKYHRPAGAAVIESLAASGTFSSPSLALDLPQARTGIEAVSGTYQLAQGNLEVNSVRARALGGTVSGQLSLAHLAGTPAAKLSATIHDVSLKDARKALKSVPPQAADLAGRVNANVEASWRGSLQDLEVRSDGELTGSAAAPPAAGAGAIPLAGVVHLAYDGRNQVLTLTNTSLRTPHSSVNVDGSLGKRASLRVSAQSGDLHEVDLLALMFRSSPPTRGAPASRPPQPFGLAGSASWSGTVQGTLNAPQLTGTLTAANLHYSGAALKTLAGNVSLSPSGIAIRQGHLQDMGQGSAQFDVALGLRDWSYTAQSPISARLRAQGFSVANLEHMTGLKYPVSGTLSADLTLNGSQSSPAGQGSVQLTNAEAWDQPIRNLIVKFQGTGTDVHSTLSLSTPAGSVTAALTYYPKQEGYEVQVQAPSIQLQRVAPVAGKNPQMSGTIAVAANGRGTLKDPQLKVTLGAPRLQIGEQSLSGLKVEATVANQQAQLELALSIAGASLQAQGAVGLTGGHDAHMTVESQPIQLGPLLASLAPQASANLKGETQIHASLDGPLGNPQQLRADVEIPTLSLEYQSFRIAGAAPIHLEYRGGVLTLEPAELKGTETDLHAQGTVPVLGSGDVRATANGSVNLRLLQLWNPQWRSSGHIDLNLSAQGNRAHPDVRGSVRLADISMLPPGLPVGVEEVNGELDFGQGRVEVKSLSGQAGGGSISAQGFAAYTPAPQFNLGLTAKDVRLLYPDGVRSQLDADLNLTGTRDSALLNGQVFLDQLSLTQSFDLSSFVGQFSNSPPSTPGGLMENIKLNVAVLSREQLGVGSSQLSMQGSANLRVQGTLAEPVVLGRADITSGELFFQGRRYQVQSGAIEFVNPVETEPVVNLIVTTTVQQFNLSLNFVGPLDRLRTTYTSDPPLSPVDIISLLVQGHTTQAAQASPGTPQSLLAQGLSGEVSSRVQKLVGISSLTIDPQIGGNQGNAGSQLAIQQRVTKNLFFTFATDITTTQGAVVQVEYQISRKYAVSAVRDQTGGYQLQVKVHRTF